jgi:hypothetical protein
MATAAQITANRENAARSTGPVTPQGKATSAANATKHGLSAAFSVLPHESLDEYNDMYNGYLAEFSPDGYHETFLVQQMIQARWRILRIQRLELRLLTDATQDHPDPDHADSAILAAMHRNGTDLATALQRYAAAAERSYYRAHKELTASRARAVQAQAAHARLENAAAEQAFWDVLNAPIPATTTELQNKANPEPDQPAQPIVDNRSLRLLHPNGLICYPNPVEATSGL